MTVEMMTLVDAMKQVVRGERPWTVLRELGISLSPEQRFADDIPPIELQVDLQDLAKGFVTYLDEPVALGEWAFVMEALPTDFQAEEHPMGEEMMDALWRASFGDPLSDGQVKLLHQLAAK